MTGYNLTKQTHIHKENLDPNNYTLSLIQEGYRAGLIDQSMVESLQMQIMFILGDIILRYTKGESTSVKNETAQSLLLSILYSIDACILNLNDPEKALVQLKTEDIKVIYEKGVEMVTACLGRTRKLYDEIIKKRLDIPLEEYNSSIDSIAGFFTHYGVVFNAHDIPGVDIDYPLVFDDMRVQGVFYIKNYLETLKIETSFCQYFGSKDITEFLVRYGQMYHVDYRSSMINVFEVLLTGSIFAVLAGNFANELVISKYQYEVLCRRLENMDPTKLSSLIRDAIETVLEDLKIEDPPLMEYIRRFGGLFTPRLQNAVANGSLFNLIIHDEETDSQPNIVFDMGKRMDNETFREIIDAVLQCDNPMDKINIITSSIHSLEDFIDVLKADCLFEDEFEILYRTLGDMELSILARLAFAEEIRSKGDGFSLLKIKPEETEMVWQAEYVRFLQKLSPGQIVSIEDLMKSPVEIVLSE